MFSKRIRPCVIWPWDVTAVTALRSLSQGAERAMIPASKNMITSAALRQRWSMTAPDAGVAFFIGNQWVAQPLFLIINQQGCWTAYSSWASWVVKCWKCCGSGGSFMLWFVINALANGIGWVMGVPKTRKLGSFCGFTTRAFMLGFQ